MKSKRVSFGYEDTDQKIEVDIYGLVFEINKKNIVMYMERLNGTLKWKGE